MRLTNDDLENLKMQYAGQIKWLTARLHMVEREHIEIKKSA